MTGKLHLWLGLASGIIVCFLGITGCMLVFEREIESLTIPEQFVTVQQAPLLAPSLLKASAEKALGKNRKVVNLEYPSQGKAALAYYYTADEYYMVLLDPYTGAVLRVRNMNRDFFRIVINGHYYLWLPPKIGQPIVAGATLVFLILLITGIFLWWPKNKGARKQRFSIKWNARWRRKNYDLHNVLGFYASGVLIFIALTGLVMGFQWVAKSVYWVSSAGKAMPAYAEPLSDSGRRTTEASPFATTDKVWRQYVANITPARGVAVTFPETAAAPIELSVNHRPGTYYNRDNYFFDQYTAAELPATNVYAGIYKNASAADKIQRMNYDIHVGAIGGLLTKILAFFSSLIAASLPVTGFLVWRGRKKKKKYVHAQHHAPKTVAV